MEKISVLAITKNGVNIGKNLKELFPDWNIFAPEKFSNGNNTITWYSEPTSEKIVELFKNNDGLVCLFSLGAVIRLIAKHLKDKKTDPAVIVIDDKTNFVISVLSGHIGGANNKESIGIFQEVGNKKWFKELPKNVTVYDNIEDLKKSNSKSHLIISDKIINDDLAKESVIYRPPSLVIGIGLHWDTSKETIKEGIEHCLKKFKLSSKSIAKLVSIKKPEDVQGLINIGKEMGIPVEYVNREDLAEITAPNPSDTVKAFEGTASVSEAAAIKISGGELIVEKQKFPPNLTIAIARIVN
jgi:cobalt-precorrin 5A hydrolase